jgi:hypothetical protein
MTGIATRVNATVVTLTTLIATSASAGAIFVQGEVPDWNQPYTYVGPPFGPGPNPAPVPGDPFDAWCGPVSAANVLGHWEDVRAVWVADGVPWMLPVPPAPPWPPGGAPWHDYSLNDTRPAPGPNPAIATDAGWYMDTNNSGATARANAAHVGTYTKDIHAGLQDLLGTLSHGFVTGTRARLYGLGTDSDGTPATSHPDEISAFEHIVREIDANRSAIVTWRHWTLLPPSGSLAPNLAAGDESQFGGDYHDFDNPGSDTSGNDEVWEEDLGNPQQNLGHITTAVGYVRMGDPDDINAPGNPTNWVIVHDNHAATHRNVIVPLMAPQYATDWDANTTVTHSLPVTVSVDPKDTYLHIEGGDSAGDAVPIHLPALGIHAGDIVQLRRVGDWSGVGPDTDTAMVGIFSASDVLLAQNLLDRVQDAIDAGADHVTAPTYPSSEPTDVPEDFFISDIGVLVPAGAQYLFVAARDNKYSDNSDPDGDFAVEIGLGSGIPALPVWGALLLAAVVLGFGFRSGRGSRVSRPDR